jgi:hypothetical protein
LSDDVWYWLVQVPFGAALVVGVATLVRHRRRSPRAAGLALAALCGLAGWWLLPIVLKVTNGWGWVPVERRKLVVWTHLSVREAWLSACLLLVVFAVLADRRGGPPPGPEADYADPDAAAPGAPPEN